MSGKTALLAVAMVLALGLSVVGGYFLETYWLTNNGDNQDQVGVVDEGLTGAVQITPPSEAIQRSKPTSMLDIALELGHEIEPGQHFTEVVMNGGVITGIEESGDGAAYLLVEKTGVVMKLSMLGVVGVRKGRGNESIVTLVSEIYELLNEGDEVEELRMAYLSDRIRVDQNTVVNHFDELVEGTEHAGEMMKANSTLGKVRLSDEEVVSRFESDVVKFVPEELLILSMTVE